MEATAGIEPAYTALQAAASPLRHVAVRSGEQCSPEWALLLACSWAGVKDDFG